MGKCIQLEEAKIKGEKTYFTGKVCVNGHIDVRLVSNRRCKSCLIKAKKLWSNTGYGKQHKKDSDRKYYEKNHEIIKQYITEYKKINKGKVVYWNTLRKKHIRVATPTWADKVAIRKIYELCPEGHQVDHIVPLRGKNVCRLNIPSNLQYLTIEDNLRKSNSF
jgi:ribosomal protein S18